MNASVASLPFTEKDTIRGRKLAALLREGKIDTVKVWADVRNPMGERSLFLPIPEKDLRNDFGDSRFHICGISGGSYGNPVEVRTNVSAPY